MGSQQENTIDILSVILNNYEKSIIDTFSNTEIEQLKEFERASKEFDKLVEIGVLERRGNTLISITEIHKYRFEINK